MTKQTARIEKWTIAGASLYGTVYDHPNPDLEDGTFVRTSHVTKLDRENGVAETLNTNYILGEEYVPLRDREGQDQAVD